MQIMLMNINEVDGKLGHLQNERNSGGQVN